MYPNFEAIKQIHDWGINQDLDWYCKYNFINKDEYKQLTGQDYGTNTDQQQNAQTNQGTTNQQG